MTTIDKIRLSVDTILVGGTATAGYFAIANNLKIEEKDKEIATLKQEKEQLVVDAGIEVNKLIEQKEGLIKEGQEQENKLAEFQNELAQCKNKTVVEVSTLES